MGRTKKIRLDSMPIVEPVEPVIEIGSELPKYKPFLDRDMFCYKGEYEPILYDNLSYCGEYEAMRKLGVSMFGPEAVAIMTDKQLCNELQKYYAVVSVENESVKLVLREKLQEYHDMVVELSR